MSQADSVDTTIAPGGANVPAVAEPGREPTASNVIAFLAMIERAARDPDVDIDKLERLLDWKDRSERREAELKFNDALAAAQEQMKPICADAVNSHTGNSRYATHAALDGAVRSIYTAHGFGLTFDTEDTAKQDTVRLICDVSHRDGHMRRYRIELPADGQGPKGGTAMNRTHATGSAITYGRRYLESMIFNLAVSRTDDDDGNAAGHRPPPPAQGNRHTPMKGEPVPPQGNPTSALPPRHRLEHAYHPHPADANPPGPRRGPAEPGTYDPNLSALVLRARDAARKGREAASEFCLTLTKVEYESLKPKLPELEALVKEAEKSAKKPKADDGLDIPAYLRRPRQ